MIELLTTSVFVLSSIYGGPTLNTDTVATTTAPLVSVRAEEQATTSIPTRKELENIAKAYFKDDPILVEIAKCESSFQQLDKNGNIYRGKVNKSDLGLMQINEYYHADRAEALGLDIKTLVGNMAYAKDLYDREGTKPWLSSSKCWKQSDVATLDNQIALK